MKKLSNLLAIALLVISMSSCATIFGGPVSEYQRTKPEDGEPQRKVRTGALIADAIIFFPSLIVDFATGAIYKPEGN
ncbi:hypothetical protein [Algoriphagus namhaensis]